jgi:gas vesicle protein
MRTLGKFLFGAILGTIVGGVLALLFAPVAGNDLRARIYDYCTNIRDEVKNAAAAKAQALRKELSALQGK